MPESRSSLGWRATSASFERPLDLAPERDQLAEVLGLDGEARPPAAGSDA